MSSMAVHLRGCAVMLLLFCENARYSGGVYFPHGNLSCKRLRAVGFCDIILKKIIYRRILSVMKKFLEFVRTLFSGGGKAEKRPEVYETDCLVGVVRDRRQLEANLAGKFYHVPARFVYELDMPIKYIALYTSASTFGRGNAGIHRYGKIKSFRAVPRYQITALPKNSPEMYFVFEVEEWETLGRPVRPLETAQVVTMTSLALIKKSEYMPELYMRSEEQFLLFQYLKDICLNGADKKKYNYNGTKIAASGDTIEVIFKNGERRKFDRSIFNGRPFSLYRKLLVKSG